MAVVTTCAKSACKSIHSSACVFYEGPSLLYTGIKTNDSVEVALQRLETFLSTTLPGVGSSQISFEKDVFQLAHGFIVGNAIRHDGSKWVKAQANILANSGTLGIISDVRDVNNFTYQFGGHLAGGGPWTEGVSYFLSINSPGAVVPEEIYGEANVREFIGTGTPDGLLLELDLGDLYNGGVIGGGGGASNTITDYRSSFETDGYVYAGYLLNLTIVITRTKDGVLETAQGLTDLETDWTNRLTLTYA